MRLQIALAGSPLTESHLPKTLDVQSLRHHLTNIPEIRQGVVRWDVEFDTVGDGKPHHSARLDFLSHMGDAYLDVVRSEKGWVYKGITRINGETREYEGQTSHNSIEAIARTVRSFIKYIL